METSMNPLGTSLQKFTCVSDLGFLLYVATAFL